MDLIQANPFCDPSRAENKLICFKSRFCSAPESPKTGCLVSSQALALAPEGPTKGDLILVWPPRGRKHVDMIQANPSKRHRGAVNRLN